MEDRIETKENTLFELSNTNKGKTCLTCLHRERHECNSKVVQYCGLLKSNRTNNGQLKIKCKTPACIHYSPFKQIN